MAQEFTAPVGLQAVLEKARTALSISSISSNEVLKAIKKTIDSLSGSSTKDKVIGAYTVIKTLKKKISNPKDKALVIELVMKPMLKTIGREYQEEQADKTQDNKSVAVKQVLDLGKQYKTEEDTIHSLRDFGPKGQEGRGINTRTRIYTALDNLIIKLAALQQPLGMRPDYDSGLGTTGDMSKRLEQIKESLSKNEATMIKQIPPMPEQLQMCSPESPAIEDYDEGPQPQAEGPKIIVIEDYDDESEVPCCPGCGQAMPEQMTREAHCLDRRFKAIRDALRKSGLKESQLKVIHSNLDSIYDKYRALEKDMEKD